MLETSITSHAARRLQQRGIPGMDIEIGEERQRHRFPNGPLATQDIETTVQRMFLALP